jgi:hypothetical protein
MQSLIKEGYGFALIGEGMSLDNELTTRPIAGVDWTVDTALIYRSDRHPKTIPVVVRQLKRQLGKARSSIGERETGSAFCRRCKLSTHSTGTPEPRLIPESTDIGHISDPEKNEVLDAELNSDK